MKYAELTTANKFLIKRFAHRKRFIKCCEILKEYQFNNLLDYGTGNGELIKYLYKKYKKKNYYLFEPDPKMRLELNKNLKKYNFILYSKAEKLKNNFYDIISVNEVLEHLSEKNIILTLKVFKRILVKEGKIIISVPIEVGLSSLFKNIFRIITKQTHENTTMKNIFKSLLYFKIKRKNLSYNNSHIGFDYNDLIILLKKKNFKIIKIFYSPFSFMKTIINSQVYLVLGLK